MSANAPRPYTGALFIDYLLSEEGQKIVVTHQSHARARQGQIAGEASFSKARTCARRIFSI